MRFSRTSRRSLAALGLAGACLMAAFPAAAASRVGALDCNVSGGVGFVITSQRALSCIFSSDKGGVEYYYGTVRRFGLDIGVTGPGKLSWLVFAATRPGPGALAGDYVGGTASVSLGAGVGANALIGGFNDSFALQPLSLETQTGVDIAAGIGALTLEPGGQVAPPRRRPRH
jgi:hypothetical protein